MLGQQSSGRGEQASATSTVDDMNIPWDTGLRRVVDQDNSQTI